MTDENEQNTLRHWRVTSEIELSFESCYSPSMELGALGEILQALCELIMDWLFSRGKKRP